MSIIETNRVKQYILLTLAEIVGGLIITGFSIIFQRETNFQSIMDAIMIAGIVLGFFGWILLLSCIGIYETFEFWIMFIASKLRKEEFEISFYEAVSLREKTDVIAYRSMFIASLVFVLTGSIMYYIYYTQMIV